MKKIIERILIIFFCYRSKEFRPAYSRLSELRSLVPPGTPVIACTATATSSIKADIISALEMHECVAVTISLNRSNIKYIVRRRTSMKEDFKDLVIALKTNLIRTPRVIVYCSTLMLIADLFEHFSDELKGDQYYPPGASHLWLFGMFHAKTPEHSKSVVMKSLVDPQVGLCAQNFAY